MVKEMQTSVAGFKLPGVTAPETTVVQSVEQLAEMGMTAQAKS